MALKASLRACDDAIDHVLQTAVDLTDSSYAMFWAVADGELRVHREHNPHGLHFTRDSRVFSFRVGEGAVGRVYSNQHPEFFPSVRLASPGLAGLARAEIAERDGIYSMELVPHLGGVLEVGTTDKARAEAWAATSATSTLA